ncbi:MAG: hypothetical protein LBU84_13515 [Prevotella sp.]|jgi:hypothetical protein|nr:hypothetical protein [Prevotella sp.]
MYKKIIINLSFLVITLFVIQSCVLSNREIEDKYWKFSDIRRGNPELPLRHQIDHIVFSESRYYFLVKDTIYREDIPYAVIIDRQKTPSIAIEIVLIGSTDTIRYVAKGNR